MIGNHLPAQGLLAYAVLCLALGANAASPPKEDGKWSNYYNAQVSYCVDYPSRWVSGDAFEGAGFFLKPALNPHSKSLTEIDIAALPDHRAGSTLLEEAQLHMKNLQMFELAKDAQILDQHDSSLCGSPALVVKGTYYDTQNNATMIDEIVLAPHDGFLYRIDLATRAGEIERYDLVFQHLLRSFRCDCPPHPLPRNFASSRPEKARSNPIVRPVTSVPRSVAN